MGNHVTVREINSQVFAGSGSCYVSGSNFRYRVSLARTRKGKIEGKIISGSKPLTGSPAIVCGPRSVPPLAPALPGSWVHLPAGSTVEFFGNGWNGTLDRKLAGSTEILPTLQEIEKEVEVSNARIYKKALTLIEAKARKLLLAHPNLDEFVMAMGGWSFTSKNDQRPDIAECDQIPAYARPFQQMMDKFSDLNLKVTGEPMRFTATGPLVSDWGMTTGMDGAAVAAQYGEKTNA